MAVTKTHPIKQALKAAIDYICNPEKTDGKLLVSAYGCAAETADIEFAWTRRHAIDKGTNLGRHPIQAFQPGEVTPEQAAVGQDIADKAAAIKGGGRAAAAPDIGEAQILLRLCNQRRKALVGQVLHRDFILFWRRPWPTPPPMPWSMNAGWGWVEGCAEHRLHKDAVRRGHVVL